MGVGGPCLRGAGLGEIASDLPLQQAPRAPAPLCCGIDDYLATLVLLYLAKALLILIRVSVLYE